MAKIGVGMTRSWVGMTRSWVGMTRSWVGMTRSWVGMTRSWVGFWSSSTDCRDEQRCFYGKRWPGLSVCRLTVGILVWITFYQQATSQSCTFPSPLVIHLLETDPAGTELFNVSNQNGLASYRFTTNHSWLVEFLNLSLDASNQTYFMQLNKPMDLEEIYYDLGVKDLVGFGFRLYCRLDREQFRDYTILVEAVSEWPPEFNTSRIEVWVNESLPVNRTVIALDAWASDKDVNPSIREIAGYSFLPYKGDSQSQVNGHNWLLLRVPYDGIVTLKKELDYEALPFNKKFVKLGVCVTDQSGKTGTASLTVHVLDDDDLPPYFTHPGCLTLPCEVSYSTVVTAHFTGLLTHIRPAPIYARDGDALNYTIEYYIVQGPELYDKFVNISRKSGLPDIYQPLEDFGASTMVLIIEAREVSPLARSARTTLLIRLEEHKPQSLPLPPTDDVTVIAVASVLGVLIAFAVAALVVMLVHFKKRDRKTVHPGLSASGTEDNEFEQRTNSPSPTTFYNTHARSSLPHKTWSTMCVDSPDQDHNSSTWTNQTSPVSPDFRKRSEMDANHLVSANTVITSTKFPFSVKSESSTDEVGVPEQQQPRQPTLTVVSGLKAVDESGDNRYASLNNEDDVSEPNQARPEEVSVAGRGSEDSSMSSLDSGGSSTSRSSGRAPLGQSAASLLNSDPKLTQDSLLKENNGKSALPDNEELMYDGTKSMENLELDFGFYSDPNKKRVKRSSRLTAITPDPSDTRYWITVTDDC